MEIKVKYKIGDIVQHIFNGAKYKVIGYNYVKGRGCQYICMQSEKEDWLYLLDCELKKGSTFTLGFICKDGKNQKTDQAK